MRWQLGRMRCQCSHSLVQRSVGVAGGAAFADFRDFFLGGGWVDGCGTYRPEAEGAGSFARERKARKIEQRPIFVLVGGPTHTRELEANRAGAKLFGKWKGSSRWSGRYGGEGGEGESEGESLK